MLRTLGFSSLDELVNSTVPEAIRLPEDLQVESGRDGLCEQEALSKLRDMMSKNKVHKSFIGNGFHDTVVPEVIKRNHCYIVRTTLTLHDGVA